MRRTTLVADSPYEKQSRLLECWRWHSAIALILLAAFSGLAAEKARVTAKSGLLLRDQPTLQGNVLAKLPLNTQVETQENQEADGHRWWRISFQGKTGWASGDFIDFNLKDPIVKKISGKFLRIEVGDYHHLVIDHGGKELSFFILRDPAGLPVTRILDNQAKFKGKAMHVFWKMHKFYIPEAGGFDTVAVVVKVE
jgi:uncharacterized protein YgiM (DUF1202 family)